jgi:CRISPR-associated protein Csb2
MLVIEIRLLAGRFGASSHNDRSAAEWPPHPGRLFSALVHTWADADEPDPVERADLVWLEALGAPRIACSSEDELTRRSVVTAYVPGNDPAALGKVAERERKAIALAEADEQHQAEQSTRSDKALAKARISYREVVAAAAAADPRAPLSVLEVLPEQRNRQPRLYPVVRPDNPVITYVWPDADLDPDRRDRLDGLLARMARFGHSATPVACRVRADAPERITYGPSDGGDLVLRVPRSGLLDELEREFARHQGRRERTLPADFATYGPPGATRAPSRSGVLAGDWIVLPLEQPALGLARSLELTRAFRDALAAAEPAAAPYLTGRFEDGTPRPHAAFLPLADVGHRWATGLIRGVALLLPREVSGEDRDLVDRAIAAWERVGSPLRLPDGSAVRTGSPNRLPARSGPAALWADTPYALRPGVWRKPRLRWVSVTPVALDRHVKDPYRSPETLAVIAAACVHAGLPEPVEVVISAASTLAGVPRASGRDRRLAFPPFIAAGSGRARMSVHAAITFEEDVTGPVLIGAGRYLGRGLFLPVETEVRDGS